MRQTAHSGPMVVSDGIVGCWDAAGKRSYPGTGTTWTDVAGDVPATLNNASFVNINHGIFSFDGTNDWITVSTSYNLVSKTSPFTVSFWVMPTAAPTDDRTEFTWRDGAGSSLVIYWNHSGYGTWSLRWNFAGTYRYEIDDYHMDDYYNQWVNMCLTYNGSGTNTDANWQLYFNNAAVTTPTGFGAGGGSWGDTIWGAANNGSREFIGYMGKMLIYDKQLSADEVSQNYHATKGRFA